MAVYVSNLTVNTGTTFSQIFTLESADTNSATDLTGFTASAQMRKHPGASKATDFSTTITNATGGKIRVGLTTSQTAALNLVDSCMMYLLQIQLVKLQGF